MRFCRVYFWVVLCVAPFATALAQRLAAVTTGTRLRVVTCDGEVVTGEFGGLRGDTLDMAINRRVTSAIVPESPDAVAASNGLMTRRGMSMVHISETVFPSRGCPYSLKP